MDTRKGLLLTVVLSLSLTICSHPLLVDGGQTQVSREKKVVRVKYEGLAIVAPHFDQNVTFTRERQELESQLFSQIREFSLECSKALLHDSGSVVWFVTKNFPAAWTLVNDFKGKYNDLVKRDPSPRFSAEYAKMVRGLMKSIKESKSAIKMPGKEAHKRVVITLDALQALVDASPVGSYLDWLNTTINRTPFVLHFAPMIQCMYDNGYGPMIDLLYEISTSL